MVKSNPPNRRKFLRSIAGVGVGLAGTPLVAERTRATGADRVPIAKTRYFDGTPREIEYVPKPVYRGIQVFKNLDVHEQFTDAVNAVSFRKSPDDPTDVSFVAHVDGGPHVASKQNPSEVKGVPVQYERKETESERTKTDENASESQGSVESVETASSFDPDDLRAGARIDTNRNRSSGYATLTGTFFSEDRDDIYLLTAGHAASSTDLYRGRTGEKIAERELRLDGDDGLHDIGVYRLTKYEDRVASLWRDPFVQETHSGPATDKWPDNLNGYWSTEGLVNHAGCSVRKDIENPYDNKGIEGYFRGANTHGYAQFLDCLREERASGQTRTRVKFRLPKQDGSYENTETTKGDSGGPFIGEEGNLVTWLYDMDLDRQVGAPPQEEIQAINPQIRLFAFGKR